MHFKGLSRLLGGDREHDSFIPDFCDGPAVWRVVVSVELIAILLALSGALGARLLWPRLFLLSLYLQWIGLASCATLCLAKPLLSRQSPRKALWLTFLLLISVTLVISEVAFQVSSLSGLDAITPKGSQSDFIARNLLICVVVAIVLLRYLYVQHEHETHLRASAEARFLALQARMRPHFLFNSFNSIAALISVDPPAAEEMVLDLSELFRASLNNMEGSVSLAREIEITNMYINIEKARLGERLRVSWDIDDGLQQMQVPVLTLQPLVENAVYHGIQKLPRGGEIGIRIRRHDHRMIIEVENPLANSSDSSHGHQIALDNITQRLHLMFADAASLEREHGETSHRVRLTLPIKGAGDETGHR